jgi:hypothetical protein
VPVPPDCGWLEPLPPETLPLLDGEVGVGADDGVEEDAGGVVGDGGGVVDEGAGVVDDGGGALLAGGVELGAGMSLDAGAAGDVVVCVDRVTATGLRLGLALALALGLTLGLALSLTAAGVRTGATGAIVTVGSLAFATDVTWPELTGWFLPWRPKTNAAAKAATSAAEARTRSPRRR